MTSIGTPSQVATVDGSSPQKRIVAVGVAVDAPPKTEVICAAPADGASASVAATAIAAAHAPLLRLKILSPGRRCDEPI